MVGTHFNLQRGRCPDESGQALVEYALILGLVSVICVVGLGAIGTNVNAVIQTVADAIA